MTVAEEIYNQLGGHRFTVMTGAKNFIADKYSLRMSIPKNASKANRLEITLTPMDTYTVRFYRYTPMRIDHKRGMVINEKVTEVKTFEDIYCFQLQELFTEVTGMYTRL